MNAKQKAALDKKLAVIALNLHRSDTLTAKQMNALHTEANRINAMFTARKKALAATRKEFNAAKRTLNTNKALSTFCKSAKVHCQAFRIDEALTQFHSMKELLALETLDDCKEARIKSHISFLQHEFKHSCKIVFNEDNKKQFKFILL